MSSPVCAWRSIFQRTFFTFHSLTGGFSFLSTLVLSPFKMNDFSDSSVTNHGNDNLSGADNKPGSSSSSAVDKNECHDAGCLKDGAPVAGPSHENRSFKPRTKIRKHTDFYRRSHAHLLPLVR
ncbi:hypothetical protein CPB84DRAFT_1388671 [Gymnopilus junonius]|uniref:Uncharacterized protein n=1 Tax=Gymnopilus junonius TaxID=109634 RepID=A0A9P5TEY2_GYMJU|nr:hypothetical protein CPB84DRAFT_1388671 [Gymnopilus junonius]